MRLRVEEDSNQNKQVVYEDVSTDLEPRELLKLTYLRRKL